MSFPTDPHSERAAEAADRAAKANVRAAKAGLFMANAQLAIIIGTVLVLLALCGGCLVAVLR